MSDALETVVDEELRQHEEEAQRINTGHQRGDQPRVPAARGEQLQHAVAVDMRPTFKYHDIIYIHQQEIYTPLFNISGRMI